MDDIDRQLLTFLQKQIPLQSRPFEILGRKIGTDGADILLRIHRLKEEGLFQQISGIFDIKAFGYQKIVVAMRFQSGLEQAAEIINRHPGVVHSCSRAGDFNFWFSLALPPGEPLMEHIDSLKKRTDVKEALVLPALRVFKEENFVSYGNDTEKNFSESEKEVIRILQQDFPLCDDPYSKMARDLRISEEKVLEIIQGLIKRGCLKQIAITLSKKRPEKHSSHLIVWQIPEEKLGKIAGQIAAFEEVSQCVERRVYEEFPFGLHTQVSAGGAEGEAIAERIEQKIGKWPRQNLWCIEEYKRSRIQYFDPSIKDYSSSDWPAIKSSAGPPTN